MRGFNGLFDVLGIAGLFILLFSAPYILWMSARLYERTKAKGGWWKAWFLYLLLVAAGVTLFYLSLSYRGIVPDLLIPPAG